MDPQPSAPPVVAVVVAADPGPWLEETLTALGAQDYPALSVLVIDAASRVDVTPRVASALPGAFVRRHLRRLTYGQAMNDAMSAVEGASYLLLCDQAAAPAPAAVRLLVEESFRSNAGIVGPKLVTWDHAERLAAVGLAVDKTAAVGPLVEPGELDQAQHDGVRELLAVPGACLLVRTDLFATVGGLDPGMDSPGADVDLGWRAHMAGARVVVAPSAVVRHFPEATPRDGGLGARNRVRTVLKAYGPIHLVRVLPQLVLFDVIQTVLALLGGRVVDARHRAAAWWWNIAHVRETWGRRRQAQRARTVPDREVRRLQLGGSAELRADVRSWLGGSSERARALAETGRSLAGSVSTGPGRVAAGLAVALLVAVVFGSRHLLAGPLPAVGQLAPFPDSPMTFIRDFLSGWRAVGLGSGAPAPPAFALLGLGGLATLGNMDVLQKVLVFGAWPLGAIGAWRMTRRLGSGRTRVVAVIFYLAVPLPYDALARGRLGGLVAYAAAPWILGRLVHGAGHEPFEGRVHWPSRVAALGLLVAVSAALAPSVMFAVLVAGAGLAVGSAIAGDGRSAWRPLALAAGSVAVAAVLLFPWTLELVLPGSRWSALAGVAQGSAQAPSWGALLRFETGPLGRTPLGWAFLVAAALPLVVGRGWRLAWAVRLWFVALACVLVSWGGGQGWLPALRSPDVLLAPAAAALALAAALGVAAFEVDVAGYRLGWRQVASVMAGVAVAVATLPVLVGSLGGRWNQPTAGVARAVGSLGSQPPAGAFRVLWVGDPAAVPVDGWRLSPGVAFATSRNGPPLATDSWPGSGAGASDLVADALTVARQGSTSRLGHILAPMAVRYVVVPRRLAPGREPGPPAPLPTDLDRGLLDQVDLKLMASDPSVTVFENTAWGPGRASVPGGSSLAPNPSGADLSSWREALPQQRGPQSWAGDVPAGGQVFLSESSSPGWNLNVAGRSQPRTKAFGWANAFSVPAGGPAVLGFRTPLARYLALVAELLAVVVAVAIVVGRPRRGPAPPSGPVGGDVAAAGRLGSVTPSPDPTPGPEHAGAAP